jgi:hypothetical protein
MIHHITLDLLDHLFSSFISNYLSNLTKKLLLSVGYRENLARGACMHVPRSWQQRATTQQKRRSLVDFSVMVATWRARQRRRPER